MFSTVSSISIIVYKGKIAPKRYSGTFIVAKRELERKKHPIGTPALPIAAIVAINIQPIISGVEKVRPLLIPTYKTVIKINAAQPFILIDVQRGNEKLDTRFDIFNFSCAHCNAVGSVACDDLEKKATSSAWAIPLKIFIGLYLA